MIKPDSSSYYQQEALWSEDIGTSAREVRDAVLAMIPEDARSILDVGCGNGAITNHLPEDRRVEGCDISQAALAHVRYPSRVAEITALPFADGAFDLVLATDVLEHIPEGEYRKALDELYRVSARWLLVAVPYNEILDAATVDCASCACCFHVHWHQRSYSAERLSRLWEGKAGVVSHAFCGARWRWSSPLVVQLLHLINGRHYDFEHAQCPNCGTTYQPKPTELSVALERRVEALHYALALTGRVAWPQRSEMVMLFDKTIVASKPDVLTEDDHSPPGTLPLQIAREDLSLLADPDNYKRAPYLVPGLAKTATIFLPRLPARVRTTPNLPLALYDPVTQQEVSLQPSTEGWHSVPAVAASRSGYLLRVTESLAPMASILFEGEVDPFLSEASIRSRDAAPELRVIELSRLNEELEGKRAAGEERIEAILRLCSELEASRVQAEKRIQELLKFAEELEAKRSASEGRVEELLHLCSGLEVGRAESEHRIQELLRLAEELEAKRVAAEERIHLLLKKEAPDAKTE
ncbi:class I SAM-dependent methyltransferase [Bradyrhizobium sp. 6(2017)]|uniref:class I SAM-dependent methyltransferase n=1 Tax=Bradyrhizobium sp. 6(2017) TaxID=1197460 RepID=UPI0013E145C4|nr:class I SAM-dependent methyltransferase [Bradyrhizobium sp. 6(2017)]QIG91098.1 methyltransferase domain-containing protein [Bradyrhizobium sp. 6(2017)]